MELQKCMIGLAKGPSAVKINYHHMQDSAPMNITVLCLSTSWGKPFGPSQVHIKVNEMDEQRHSMIE